jgi:S-adenosylmethionine hydrolase
VASPFISFLSDFGQHATAPAICRGVILGIAPEARILDLTHAVRAFSIREGAFLLWSAVDYLPIGVHIAVVDPGVGTSRRPIVIRAERGDLLVGPDNGLLRPAAARLGGAIEVRHAVNRALWLPETSSTFHGRDLFAPLAAHLATGVPLDEVGPPLAVDALVDLELPTPTTRDGGLDSAVVFVDTFGNCRLAGDLPDLVEGVGRVEAGRVLAIGIPNGRHEVEWAPTFGLVGPGRPLLYRDADTAGLALAINQGSAAKRFGLALDDRVRIEPA